MKDEILKIHKTNDCEKLLGFKWKKRTLKFTTNYMYNFPDIISNLAKEFSNQYGFDEKDVYKLLINKNQLCHKRSWKPVGSSNNPEFKVKFTYYALVSK